MTSLKYTIVCRASELSLIQANSVISKINKVFPEIDVSIFDIESEGDKNLNTALRDIGGKKLFTRNIDSVVLANKNCIGVHSLKDIDSKIPDNLYLGGYQQRIDPADILISLKKYSSIMELKPNSKVGTVSLRRKAQILHIRKDLNIVSIRGNILRRLNLLKNGEFDALILAKAGIIRLRENKLIDKEFHCLELSISEHIPAPGQGIIAMTCSKDNSDTCRIIDKLADTITSKNAKFERVFVTKAEMDCFSPISAYSWNVGSKIMFIAKLYNSVGEVTCETQLTLDPIFSKAVDKIEEMALNFKLEYKKYSKPNVNFF